MGKQFILNLLLNLGLVFMVMSGYSAYQSGNMLILGIAIAVSVVLIYLKIVLLKYVKSDYKKRQEQQASNSTKNKKG